MSGPLSCAAIAGVLEPLAAGEAPVRTDAAPHADLLPGRLRDAAVLVGLLEDPGDWRVVLTRRTRHLRHHAGQVSFPGGRVDRADASRLAAALREAREEVALAADRIRPLGCLDPVLTLTGYAMVPFVATVAPGPRLRACPGEVEEVFAVPLGHILDPANRSLGRARVRGREREYHVIRFRHHVIWGATAAVLVDLAERLLAPPAVLAAP